MKIDTRRMDRKVSRRASNTTSSKHYLFSVARRRDDDVFQKDLPIEMVIIMLKNSVKRKKKNGRMRKDDFVLISILFCSKDIEMTMPVIYYLYSSAAVTWSCSSSSFSSSSLENYHNYGKRERKKDISI